MLNMTRKFAKLVLSPIPVKYSVGKTYWRIKEFLQQAQWWDRKQIEQWQLDKLKEIIEHAYSSIPGYRQLYMEAGIKPNDIQSLRDIDYLPFVTKELIRDNLDDFTSTAVSKWKRVYLTTGGSTGIPFGFYITRLNYSIEKAFMHLGWERKGWKLGDRSAVLRGAYIGSERKFWDYNSYQNELLLSNYYLTEKNYPKYAKQLLKYKALYLQAYPSAATMLADFVMTKGDIERLNFKLILLGSENVYDWQKQKLLEAFPGASLFDWYGHAEKAILAARCEYLEQYHVWPFYGLTEILDENNGEVSVGQTGELVGTSFWNLATPFIRYRTMDMATKGRFGCDGCGRKFQLLEQVEGRLQEVIVTGTGRYISMTAINMHSDVFDNIKQFQFYQEKTGEVVFKIIKKNSYSNKDTALIRRELMKKLGQDMALNIVFVNQIPKTPRGKYRFLEQKLEIKYGD